MSQHFTSVDQSDRRVPYNLRQSGRTPVEMLIFTRVRKSPFWHLSIEAGAWRATTYNRIYHPFGYVRPTEQLIQVDDLSKLIEVAYLTVLSRTATNEELKLSTEYLANPNCTSRRGLRDLRIVRVTGLVGL